MMMMVLQTISLDLEYEWCVVEYESGNDARKRGLQVSRSPSLFSTTNLGQIQTILPF